MSGFDVGGRGGGGVASAVNPTVQALGALGATETIDMTGLSWVWAEGTLDANCAVTVSNMTAGDRVTLFLVQDATGGRTLSVDGTALSIASTANAPVKVELEYSGNNEWVDVAGGGGIQETLIDAKGDLIVGSAADTAVRKAVGSNDTVLTADSTQAGGVKWAAASGSSASYADKHTRALLFDDFWSVPSAGGITYLATVSGTGSGTSAVATDATNRPGVAQVQTGTTTTGRAAYLTATSSMVFGSGACVYETAVEVVTAGDGTETYQFMAGFIDSVSALLTDGACFVYDTQGVQSGSAASANWQIVTANAATRTWTTTSTAVSVGTWQTLRIEVNAAGTSVAFYVDGTLVGTHTTNIPTGTARGTGSGTLLIKSAGTTSRAALLDFISTQIDFTSARA